MRRRATVLLLLALLGCARNVMPPQAGDAPQVQAALATITVQNLTAQALTIDFRPAGRERGRVAIGTVPPGATRRLAPVPAGEPIVLRARTPEGGAYELTPRSFALDEQWLWTIPRDAPFR